MDDAILNCLRHAATALTDKINDRPLVRSTLGRSLTRRLHDDDWIKSLELSYFLRPLESEPDPLWKPTADQLDHMQRQMAQFPQGATTLDALEYLLGKFRDHGVVGAKHWFREIGRESGYWLDKRIHSLASEIAAIGSIFEWANVAKLKRLNTASVPDYLIDLESMLLVVEVKTLFGPSWPFTVLKTAMKALASVGHVAEAEEVMIICPHSGLSTAQIENGVATMKIEALVSAVQEVAKTGGEAPISGHFLAVPKTDIAKSLNMYASPYELNSRSDFSRLMSEWTATPWSIGGAILDAWEQCSDYDVEEGKSKLDVAAISAQGWLGHPELSDNQLILQRWLETSIWPTYPNRALLAKFGDVMLPVWFVSPLVLKQIDEAIGNS